MLAFPGKILINAYFVINDFSDIVFFKKIFLPHMEVFFFFWAPYSWYFGISGHEIECVLGANIFWSYTFRFSKQEHQFLSWQTLIIFSKLKWYSVVQVYVHPNSLDSPLIGNVHIVVVRCFNFLFKGNWICSWKQLGAKLISEQSLPLWKFG